MCSCVLPLCLCACVCVGVCVWMCVCVCACACMCMCLFVCMTVCTVSSQGCLCFYPWAYALPLAPLVSAAHTLAGGSDLSLSSVVACVALFLCGWLCTRGANYQKYCAKQGRKTCLGGLIPLVRRACCACESGYVRRVSERIHANCVSVSVCLYASVGWASCSIVRCALMCVVWETYTVPRRV